VGKIIFPTSFEVVTVGHAKRKAASGIAGGSAKEVSNLAAADRSLPTSSDYSGEV